ncbi:VENN motif pre-toxin domain-containing protein, partial [Neisseria sp.]|uniref:VENN motif pre-toxin domain-containing protein n=1 Tax=Neisseria sp. TaxID=192066 RepID=UPI003916D8BC
VGATGDGGAALNAQIGGVIGQNAVENNAMCFFCCAEWRGSNTICRKCLLVRLRFGG